MTPIEKLDFILEYMKSITPPYKTRYFAQIYEVMLLHQNFSGDGSFESELNSILNKLGKDEYVLITNREVFGSGNHKVFSITFEGMLFYQQGGYTQKQSLELAEVKRIELIEQAQKDNQKKQLWLTIVLTIGTTIAAYYYLTQIYLFYYPVLPVLPIHK